MTQKSRALRVSKQGTLMPMLKPEFSYDALCRDCKLEMEGHSFPLALRLS